MIAVDVTTIYKLPRTTGIQRVVRDLVSDQETFILLRFREEIDAYVMVDKLPELVRRAESRIMGSIRARALSIAQSAWNLFSSKISYFLPRKVSSKIKSLASLIYSKVLSGWTLVEHTTKGADEPLANVPDEIWLLDIPKSKEHIRFLKRLQDSGDSRLKAYLYDLIPLTHTALIAGADSREVVKDFEAYMDVVLGCTYVLCLSDFTMNAYLEYRKNKLHESNQLVRRAYPPLDIKRFRTEKDHDRNFLASTRHDQVPLAPEAAIRLFSIAPLNKRKNLRVVLRAFHDLVLSGEDAALVLVTPTLSQLDAETINLTRQLQRLFPDRFLVHSQVDDSELWSIYKWANIVLIPSLVEGYGLPIVEALSSGCHVIASDVGVFREIRERVDISLANPMNPADWISAIKQATLKTASHPNLSNILTTKEEFVELMLLN